MHSYLKRTGPGEPSLIGRAASSKSGERNTSPKQAMPMSTVFASSAMLLDNRPNRLNHTLDISFSHPGKNGKRHNALKG
jgi:hypothetical protein